MTLRFRFCFMLLLMIFAVYGGARAQPIGAGTLALMGTAEGVLGPETPAQEWMYTPGPGPSTILVEVLDGTLDPTLTLIGAEGDALATNNDYASAYSPDARLVIPGGDVYLLRVEAAFGAGRYRLHAIPGQMHPQWAQTLTIPGPYWDDTPTSPAEDGRLLDSGLAQTRLFAPEPVPQGADVYIQGRLRFETLREQTAAGLVVRGRAETNGQVTGLRFSLSPEGVWALRANDISGDETDLANGRISLPEVGAVTLGLLMQEDEIAAYAEGQRLAIVELDDTDAPRFEDQTIWGVLVTDGVVSLQQLGLAMPLVEAPNFPTRLESWQAVRPRDIMAELVAAEAVPDEGARQFLMSVGTTYTVIGPDQRNFLITAPDALYDDLILGGDITIQEGADVGCGLVTGFIDRAHKLLAFVDTQDGGGLFWWQADDVLVNNYARVGAASSADEYRLLFIQQDHFTVLYINGILTAQSIIPRRAGALGVGFINYAADSATCRFENIWIWQ